MKHRVVGIDIAKRVFQLHWVEIESGDKNDAADARAIWTALQQPGIKAVAVKSEGQQAVLAMHRTRAQLVKFRTAQINGLRGLLSEYGEAMPQGRAGLKREIPAALGRLADRLPAVVIDSLREQYAHLGQLDEQMQEIERRLRQWHAEDEASRRIAKIPDVGLLGATAAIATMGDAKAPAASSPPGWGWCRARAEPAVECDFWASVNAAIPTFERC